MKENFGQFIMAENIAGYMRVTYDGDGDGGVSERMDPVNVLVLGGWSMSCLDRLRREFRSQCVFYEPTLYMPPVDCASLFMWESMLFASVIILLVSLVSAAVLCVCAPAAAIGNRIAFGDAQARCSRRSRSHSPICGHCCGRH